MSQRNSDVTTLTFQTRLILDQRESFLFSQFALLMNKVEHHLFAEIAKGKKASDLKSLFLKSFGITARQFNSVRVVLEGKISSIKEREKELSTDLKRRISSLESKIKKLEKKNTDPYLLHQKKRRGSTLKSKLQRKEESIKEGKIGLCFGTRKLFRKQFNLEANNYASHEEWKKEWKDVRSSNFFLIGSKDETAGNQSCVASLDEGGLSLRIRLPDALSEHGKYLVIKGIRFAYGHESIVAALLSGESVAISYRFIQDRKGWRIFVSLPVKKQKTITRSGIGVIGLDINVDRLALVETDRFGNPIRHTTYPLCTYGKTRYQALALITDAAKSIIDWCVREKKPLVLERLCFDKKKTELRETSSARYARMLSSFAYKAIVSTIKSRAFRLGVQVYDVNPAYTSIIGRVKFAKRYGFSIHESAALVIGRRLLGNSERIPRHQSIIPYGKSNYVTLSLPARNRDRHVWSLWRIIKRNVLKWCLQHISGSKKAILKSDSPACCDNKFLDFVGAIPTHESVTELLGDRV